MVVTVCAVSKMVLIHQVSSVVLMNFIAELLVEKICGKEEGLLFMVCPVLQSGTKNLLFCKFFRSTVSQLAYESSERPKYSRGLLPVSLRNALLNADFELNPEA